MEILLYGASPNNGGTTTSQNSTTTNLDRTSNPKTGDASAATKAFGLTSMLLAIVIVIKKKQQ